VITQSTSTVKCHYYFNHGSTASKLQPVQLPMKNCLKGTNHICFMTWKEATIGAGLGLTICIELGSSSIILTSRCGNVAVHLLFFAQSSSRVQVSNQWCRQASLSPYMIYLTSNMLEELSKNCCVALEGANAICFCDLLQTVVGNL
jgi:hypothetical protein